ncbi:MAG: UDP-N-acetylenolpyruvoylglucosamine reductase [Sulfurovum sp. FS08-3]|nr:MAG: UDP-N-acetylenolpyruvoylglucosamine reductase [Sulfurovum sp. FS08-3]
MQTKSIDFSKYSSIKVGSIADVMVIEKGDTIPQEPYIIGGANNLLLSPHPPPLMMLGKDFDSISVEGNELIIGGATKSGRIFSFVKKHNIAGLEFLSHLPGTLGGLVAMNAGLKSYEIFNLLNSLTIIKGEIKTSLPKDAIRHGYRYASMDGVVIEARFKLREGFDASLVEHFRAMRANQPPQPSAGSVFKNPQGDYAGRLIEAVGLKGKRVGDMAWSSIHANFLVNLGKGRFEEALYLINLAKERVKEEFEIELKEEIKIL